MMSRERSRGSRGRRHGGLPCCAAVEGLALQALLRSRGERRTAARCCSAATLLRTSTGGCWRASAAVVRRRTQSQPAVEKRCSSGQRHKVERERRRASRVVGAAARCVLRQGEAGRAVRLLAALAVQTVAHERCGCAVLMPERAVVGWAGEVSTHSSASPSLAGWLVRSRVDE